MSEHGLNHDQQRFLLNLARDSIAYYLENRTQLKIEMEDDILQEKRGVFVTLKLAENLRGCIGYPLPQDPLYQSVIEAAVLAATKDHRFPPLKPEELPQTRIEISVLSLPRRIDNVSEIEVGKHGIIVTQGLNRGLLLPQVPLEWNWDLETYLNHGSLKAGLPENAWKQGAEIEIFTAQIFSDNS
jgi:AmmeMemoRadiSam system protein A